MSGWWKFGGVLQLPDGSFVSVNLAWICLSGCRSLMVFWKKKVRNTFEIAASREEGESEQLWRVRSPWERWVKGTSRWFPFSFEDTPAFKYYCLWGRETGCQVLEIMSLRHNLHQEVGGEIKPDSWCNLLAFGVSLPETGFWFLGGGQFSAHQTLLHDRHFTPRRATSWHKSGVLFPRLSFWVLLDELRRV